MPKRGVWIAALGALALTGGVIAHFLNSSFLKDRRGFVPSMEDAAPGLRHARLDPVWVMRSTVPWDSRSAFLGKHLDSPVQWKAGQPGGAHVTLGDPPGWTCLSALVADAGSVYEWTGVLPSSASFEFRTGVLSREAGFLFTVVLVDPSGQSHLLFSETQYSSPLVSSPRGTVRGRVLFWTGEAGRNESGNTWRPARVDLSAWSGRSVRILLRVEAPRDALTQNLGLACWGAPEIWFPAVPRPSVKRGGARTSMGTNVVLVVSETTPPGPVLEGVPSPLGDFVRGAVFFPRFYTSDIRSGQALKDLLIAPPLPLPIKTPPSSPWPRVLAENKYRSLAVGAFSEEMRGTLVEAGFDEIHQLPHDGYDPLLTADRAADWARDRGRGPLLVLAFFRDLPQGRWPPARYWLLSLRRYLLSPSQWVHWRWATASAYLEEFMGQLTERLNGGPDAPLVVAVSLRGEAVDPLPVVWPGTGRRGKIHLHERGWGMRESEIKILFALRQGDRWTPTLRRSPGQILDVGPTVLQALSLPVSSVGGRAWEEGGAARLEDSTGRWVVHSPTAKALIVDGRYKYIRQGPRETRLVRGWGFRPTPARIDFPAEEIFDLWEDPGERRNLTRFRRPLLARMRTELSEADPDPVTVRLGFLNPTGGRVDGTVTCSAGTLSDVWGTVPILRGGAYDFSFSTTGASGTVTFQTWPPHSSYSLRFSVDRRPLPSGQFRVSRWGLPLFESVRNEWHDKTEFGWMDGWAPPVASTSPVASLGRVP
ncbi:MAG: hypothetical protein IPN90_08655 [Elusimicrobia bacterium]|nr:hypothetical protein [Elusimicrobiota bacterium]